jgi:hypothetical protein
VSEVVRHLRDRMAEDREILAGHLRKLGGIEVTPTSDEVVCDHVALRLHRIYTAAENLFKRIAAVFEGIPRGDRWHRDLLDQMAEESEIRPAVVSGGVKQVLGELLLFRHYVMHGSVTVPVDGERLTDLRRTALEVAVALDEDLDRFDAYLGELLSSGD